MTATRFAAAIVLTLCAGVAAPTRAADADPDRAAADALLPPPAQMQAQGVPPVPRRLAEQVAAYTEFRGHGLADWHPLRREMLVTHRAAGARTTQLFRVSAPLAPPEPLTQGPDPVGRARYEPQQGRYIVFERSRGGSEVTQLWRLDAAASAPVLLSDPTERHAMLGWLNQRSELLYTSVPIDDTAAGGSREQIRTTLWRMDPLEPASRRKVAELPGGGWFAARASSDDKQLALGQYLSANESQVWLLDLASGARRQLLPAAAADAAPARAVHLPAAFSRDDRQLFVLTDRFGEFRELARLDLADGTLQRVTAHIAWDVGDVQLSDDGREIALLANVAGRQVLHRFDAQTLQPRAAPAGLPPGSFGALRYHPTRRELGFVATGAQAPGQVHSLDLAGQVHAWTEPHAPPGLDARQFAEPQLVHWPSFDGLPISGLLTRPPARFEGKRPVLIQIHGGPEAQASVGFLGRPQYFVNELGIALIQPNVRGSTGFGKRFVALDNGRLREDAVKDIGALLDWIATQPGLDAERVLVMGGSYGGYMALAVATHYPERIAGAIDVVGISHFLTFLRHTESYRRDLRRVEYGDERESGMAEFLDRISPLTRAARIKKPLFVVQGKNDPRVPYTEAEQIVERVRAAGTPVWYLRADDEGHGFARKDNQDYQFYATVLFLQQTLLK